MNQITLDAAEAAFQWTFIAKNTEKEKYIKNQCLKKKNQCLSSYFKKLEKEEQTKRGISNYKSNKLGKRSIT